jgi:hypothetical protein
MGSKEQSPEFADLVAREIQQVAGHAQQTDQQWTAIKSRLAAQRLLLLPYQLAFLQDTSKRKVVSATRRAGKTYAVRYAAAEAVAANPWSNRRKAQPVVQYVAQTQKKALDLFWKPFRMLCDDVGMEAHWDDHNLRAEFSNGVLVRAAGVNTGFDIENYRGDAYARVIADEAGTYGPKVEALVQEAFGMALADYGGDIWLIGTPGRVKVGYFFEACNGLRPFDEGWSVHPGWTFLNNTSFPVETRTDEWIRANVGPLDSPRVRREAFGEWVTDSSTLVYRCSEANTHVGRLPPDHDWRFVLGMDLGFRDPTAFVVIAYSPTHSCAYVVHAEAHPHLLPSQIAEKIVSLDLAYGHFHCVVVDTGGSMARSTYEEWVKRFPSMSFRPAQKSPGYKYGAIEHLNSDLAALRLKVCEGTPSALVREWTELPWDDGEADDDKGVRHDGVQHEHKGFHNHLSDACLYAFMECRHYRSKKAAPPEEFSRADSLARAQQDAKLNAIAKAQQPKRFEYGRIKQR